MSSLCARKMFCKNNMIDCFGETINIHVTTFYNAEHYSMFSVLKEYNMKLRKQKQSINSIVCGVQCN